MITAHGGVDDLQWAGRDPGIPSSLRLRLQLRPVSGLLNRCSEQLYLRSGVKPRALSGRAEAVPAFRR
jgi:hypothetical protein